MHIVIKETRRSEFRHGSWLAELERIQHIYIGDDEVVPDWISLALEEALRSAHSKTTQE